jgi:hypothetical protein
MPNQATSQAMATVLMSTAQKAERTAVVVLSALVAFAERPVRHAMTREQPAHPPLHPPPHLALSQMQSQAAKLRERAGAS